MTLHKVIFQYKNLVTLLNCHFNDGFLHFTNPITKENITLAPPNKDGHLNIFKGRTLFIPFMDICVNNYHMNIVSKTTKEQIIIYYDENSPFEYSLKLISDK